MIVLDFFSCTQPFVIKNVSWLNTKKEENWGNFKLYNLNSRTKSGYAFGVKMANLKAIREFRNVSSLEHKGEILTIF